MTREDALKVAKPILFNTQMVKAILNGPGGAAGQKKTCTRRIMKPQPPDVLDENSQRYSRSRYDIGDILYVRETWAEISCEDCDEYECHRQCGVPSNRPYIYKADYPYNKTTWHPSIHMPKKAARIFLRITQVRVERLQDMDGLDALYEGVNSFVHPQACYFDRAQLEEFAKLWDSTIKKADLDKYGWEADPWVWVYEFERVEVEE